MSGVPKISICLPSLNTRPYLMERFQSIFDQTFQDWELIVCDSFSDDGSWELIQELAAKESRMRIYQTPRKGVYAGFNDCIERARGDYIYIATSDDTMSPECLERMAAALEANPDCGIAHCCLDFIDQQSRKVAGEHQWEQWFSTRFFGEWNKKSHIRPRGHDTVLAMGLRSVYYSVTQLLIRRSLFAEAGLYETKWGPFGDLEWQMRAALVTKTVHVPEYLATWRIHEKQASQMDQHIKAVRKGWFLEIADSVIRFSRVKNLPFAGGLPTRLRRFYGMEWIGAKVSERKNVFGKLNVLFQTLGADPTLTISFLKERIETKIFHKQKDYEKELRTELNLAGLNALLAVK